jgi:hypothetical protein
VQGSISVQVKLDFLLQDVNSAAVAMPNCKRILRIIYSVSKRQIETVNKGVLAFLSVDEALSIRTTLANAPGLVADGQVLMAPPRHQLLVLVFVDAELTISKFDGLVANVQVPQFQSVASGGQSVVDHHMTVRKTHPDKVLGDEAFVVVLLHAGVRQRVVKIAERATLVVEVDVDLFVLDDRPVPHFVLDDVSADVEALTIGCGVAPEEVRFFGEDLQPFVVVSTTNVNGIVFLQVAVAVTTFVQRSCVVSVQH